MKRQSGDILIEDMNLERGELFMNGNTIYEYQGIVERDGRFYDRIVPIGHWRMCSLQLPKFNFSGLKV